MDETIDAFNYFDNPPSDNVISVILNVEVPTTKNGSENPMYDALTHFEWKKDWRKNLSNWKFVYHKRLTPERKPSFDAQKCNEIMELLSDVQLLKIMMKVGPFYPKLVKEFVVNLHIRFNNVESRNYRKVHVIRTCFVFSCNHKWALWSWKTDNWYLCLHSLNIIV